MSFGREVSPEIVSFIETNWNWDTGYITKTSFLTSIVLVQEYCKKMLIDKF
jgi:hypothetical protein